MQANARNKRLLFDGIDQLVDRAIAYFGKALEFVYQKLDVLIIFKTVFDLISCDIGRYICYFCIVYVCFVSCQ